MKTYAMQYSKAPHLVIFRCELIETFLDDVVSVEIFDEHYNMKAERKNNGMNLSVVSMISLRSTVSLEDENPLKATCLASSGQEINHLLYSSRTMHVQRDANEILSDRFANNVALVIRGELKKFLAKVVAKWIRHQFSKVAERFTEYHVAMLRNTFLKLFLEVTAAMLVFAERGYFALKVLQPSTGKTVH